MYKNSLSNVHFDMFNLVLGHLPLDKSPLDISPLDISHLDISPWTQTCVVGKSPSPYHKTYLWYGLGKCLGADRCPWGDVGEMSRGRCP